MRSPFFSLAVYFYKIGAVFESRQREGFQRAPPLILSGDALAALGTAAGKNLAALLGGHTRTEPVAALADEFARLICAFHGVIP